MSNLLDQIKADLKSAMQAKEELTLSVLRMLITSLRNKEISLRKGEDVVLTDEQVLEVIGSEVKKRKDSIESYREGGREDLAKTEEDEIAILSKYLPEQMSDEDLASIVDEVLASQGDNPNFGAVMGAVMGRVKGLADGNAVSAMVKKKLG